MKFELDLTIAISESRMKRVIVHSLRHELRSFVAFFQTQLTIGRFENLLANQETISKQMSGDLNKE